MKVDRLKIELKGKVLLDINFNIENSLALVGQSGSGKSLTLKALLGMLPHEMKLELECEAGFELIRGETISFVPQNPFTALSPLTKIKKQIFIEQKQQDELFKSVGLGKDLLNRFPPELSGGQLQRVVIAMALESKPKLLMLDEPTTSLDPKTRVLILNLLKELQIKLGFKILFVTHDMNSAKSLCNNICIIKDGKLIEDGRMLQVLKNPKEEYTKVLIEANFANREFRK